MAADDEHAIEPLLNHCILTSSEISGMKFSNLAWEGRSAGKACVAVRGVDVLQNEKNVVLWCQQQKYDA